MTEKTVGLIEKYRVERSDAKPVRWCFVLEDTDPLAPAVLEVYADYAEAAGYMELAHDLRDKIRELPRNREPWESQPVALTQPPEE
jgi:hypothetical protein